MPANLAIVSGTMQLEPQSVRRRSGRHQTMDDKTINLWRQIEDCRRRGKGRSADRSKPAAVPTRETVAS